MGHKAHMRIAAVCTAIIIILSGSACYGLYCVSAFTPDRAGLGYSGEFPELPDGPGQEHPGEDGGSGDSGTAGKPDGPSVPDSGSPPPVSGEEETPDFPVPDEKDQLPVPAPDEESSEEKEAIGEAAPLNSGTLELVSAPALLHYGISTLPTTTTLYKRAACDNVTSDGKMLIEVTDTRGIDSTDWMLCVQMGVLDGKQPFPDGSLVFLDGANKHTITYAASAPVYSGHRSTAYTDYALSWGDNQGLLAEITPGTTQVGAYASVLSWSVQSTP